MLDEIDSWWEEINNTDRLERERKARARETAFLQTLDWTQMELDLFQDRVRRIELNLAIWRARHPGF